MSLQKQQLEFIKMAIQKVKDYAYSHKCPISEACGPITGISPQAYQDAIQLMISSGYRTLIYNKVQIPWDELDVIRNNMIRTNFPHLYREITIPEISIREQNDQGIWYLLSDNAYDEWCSYQKEHQQKDQVAHICVI